MKRFTIVVSALVLGCLARDAAAQGFVNPFIGTTLTSPSIGGDRSKPGFGIAFGSIGKIVGFESEFAYYRELLDNSANGLEKNKVITFSGNTLIGPMIGPVKAYGAFGFGDLYLNVTKLQSIVIPTADSRNYFTFNVGGGAMGFFSSHFGVRGDLRFYRAFGFNFADFQSSGLTLDKFEFWRANIGFVAKF